MLVAAHGRGGFPKDLGATHSLAHPLFDGLRVASRHGHALCLPAVMKFNAQARPGLYRRAGLACGLDVVKATLWRRIGARSNWLKQLRRCGLNRGISDYGVKAAQTETLADQASRMDVITPIPCP